MIPLSLSSPAVGFSPNSFPALKVCPAAFLATGSAGTSLRRQRRPPLELFSTVHDDEGTSLTGKCSEAEDLNFLQESTLLQFNTEDWGDWYSGCVAQDDSSHRTSGQFAPSATTTTTTHPRSNPLPSNRLSTTLYASKRGDIGGGSDTSDESDRYRAQAEKLREEIRQMETALGPTRRAPPIPPEEELDPADSEMSLRGKRVLVAGANGRLGSMVCRYLLRNHPQTEVVAAVHYVGENSPTSRGYGRLSYEVGAEDGIGSLGPAWSEERDATFTYNPEVMQSYNLQNLRLVECEFLDPVQCETVVEGCDAVIWCATDFNGNLPRAVSGLNVAFLFRAVSRPDKGRVEVEGLQNMLSALRKEQLDRKRKDQFSSTSISSKRAKGANPINFVLVSTDAKAFKDTETPFGSFYGIKQRGEELMREDFPSITSTVLRLGRFDDNFVPEDLSVNLTSTNDNSAGEERLINRRDAARAVVDALTNKDLLGKTVNVWTQAR